jgi:hypothetical protein
MTIVNQQYLNLNPTGGTPREISNVVNNIMIGKTNNVGTITLNTGWASTTTIYDERIGYDSIILLTPSTDAAEADTAPYGEFYSTSDQFAPSTSGTAVCTFDTTAFNNGIYVDSTNTSRIYVRNDGIYNVAFTVQLINNSNDGQYADIWYRVNGSDVADSASRFGLPARKSSGSPSELIGAMNIFLDLNAGDYVEITGGVSSTDVSLWHDAASTSPFTRPAIPSVVTTVNYVAPLSMDSVLVTAQTKGQATISHFANNTADKTYKYLIVG